jgi:hypothetical protein
MKKAGIVCDDYKLEKFKKELTAKGFTDFKIFAFTPGTSTIQVNVKDDEVIEIKKICELVELYFKRRN